MNHFASLGHVAPVVFPGFWPHVEGEQARLNPVGVVAPVLEAQLRAVSRKVEPALVAAKDLSVEGRGVNVGALGAVVGASPGLIGQLRVKRRLFVADTNNHRIVTLDPASGEASVLELRFGPEEDPAGGD